MKLGVKNINLTHINLNDTISDMLFFFKDKIELKQLRIKLENLLEEDDLVIAEATSLSHQVLSNIMSNAIKFSEENSLITISLKKQKINLYVSQLKIPELASLKTILITFSASRSILHDLVHPVRAERVLVYPLRIIY